MSRFERRARRGEQREELGHAKCKRERLYCDLGALSVDRTYIRRLEAICRERDVAWFRVDGTNVRRENAHLVFAVGVLLCEIE